jgi:asparagine synthase (glutamine-hydrolysing)
MCGIVGFIDRNANYDFENISKRMGQAIAHRGPDGSGVLLDKELGVSLIHRRLSILDLSSAGSQPMVSNDGRYIITFNGEVYNHPTIKYKLESIHGQINWRGHSDTEIVLKAFETYGIVDALQYFEGMFAIGLWDRQDKKLYLIRDRIGEKPLYYGYFGGIFAFASELKAFKAHPKFNPEVNRDAIGQLLLHNCIPAPISIFSGVNKLTPGHYLELSYQDCLEGKVPASTPYWQLSNCLNKPGYMGNEQDAVSDLDCLLRDVISQQMIADVPLGCFLSGGIDSSLIASIMQTISDKPIKTFTIGFDVPEYNEAVFAKAVAKHLGTDHHELYVTHNDVLDVIPKLPFIYDEPFADSSQIPTYLVAKLAKTEVSVSLSGDAGDELFVGYTRYLLTQAIYDKINLIPKPLKPVVQKLLHLATPNLLSVLGRMFGIPLNNISDKIYKLDHVLTSSSFLDLYTVITSHWLDYNKVVKELDREKFNSLWLKDNCINDKVLQMQYLDTLGYLPDDILTKVDRAAMANSLETRMPFLNHKIIEFAYSLPSNYQIQNGKLKWLLRQVLDQYVPRQLIDRPKAGFGIPLNQWLRSGLKDWAASLLDSSKLKHQGYFNVTQIEKRWNDHIAGKANNGYYLWDVLMFQQWLEEWKTN